MNQFSRLAETRAVAQAIEHGLIDKLFSRVALAPRDRAANTTDAACHSNEQYTLLSAQIPIKFTNTNANNYHLYSSDTRNVLRCTLL